MRRVFIGLVLVLAASHSATAAVRDAVEAGRVADLRWPDFRDYKKHVTAYYEKVAWKTGWVNDAGPTPQALAVIALLEKADAKGLNAADYDGPLWAARVATLRSGKAGADDRELFDVALTVSAMRYISDLRIGRINPENVGFGLEVGPKKLDLPSVVEGLLTAKDPAAALEPVEPPFPAYRALRALVPRYIALAREPFTPVPAEKALAPGKPYGGAGALAQRLVKTGDLAADAVAGLPPGVYGGALVDAVKRFQKRHGIAPDGKPGERTFDALNTPFEKRLEQIRLSLERWRWLPARIQSRVVLVNIPEFMLRALEPAADGSDFVHTFQCGVVVGKAFRHKTPVFHGLMRYVVFRPYWNVPTGILRNEVLPKAAKDPAYLEKESYEIATGDGKTVLPPTAENIARLRSGGLVLRQKPGPKNALGLVKFMFPSPFDVYLHDTPAQSGFKQARRDFSHGCVRVEKPFDLARWVLSDQPEWTPERIRAAMDGASPRQVNLVKPIPVLILYATALVDRDGTLNFLDDIYGHDAELAEALAEGYPYPI